MLTYDEFHQYRRVEHLLYMKYRPEEIEAEISAPPGIVQDIFIPAGCPHERDSAGQVWVIGTELCDWIKAFKDDLRSARHKMHPGESWCADCRAAVTPNWAAATVVKSLAKVELLEAPCPTCKRPILKSRPIRKPKQKRPQLINRENYLTACQWFEYLRDVRQLDAKTIERCKIYMLHVLEWLGEMPLAQAPDKRPTLPQYLITANKKNATGQMSIETRRRTLAGVKLFFRRIHSVAPRKFKTITDDWIETLRPARAGDEIQRRKFYQLEEVYKLVSLPTSNLRQKRDRAAIAFMFLSGMRIGAFVTLPIDAVDIQTRTVRQLPSLGVRTKNKKAAITYLLSIPLLLAAVTEWDQIVRSQPPESGLWYAHISRRNPNCILPGGAGEKRRYRFDEGLRELCQRAQIEFRSPHKFRHGHAVFALQRIHTMADMKAVSQNLMHSSITITDKIYGVLDSNDVQQRIGNIPVELPQRSDLTQAQIMKMLAQAYEQVKSDS